MTVFNTIGLIGRQGNPLVAESLSRVAALVLGKERSLVVESASVDMLEGVSGYSVSSRLEIGNICDLLIVVGGDGSLLGVARDLSSAGLPVLGINRGGLGFLAAISPEQITAQVSEVLEGAYLAEDHFLLKLKVLRAGQEIASTPAMNDVVLHTGTLSRMLEFALYIDGEFVYEQKSDGLIVATPTGSTAYALSAGGPIMHPKLDAIVVVPMFPHTLTSRPLVICGDAEIKLLVKKVGDIGPQVSCDSQVDIDLQLGDEIYISKYEHRLKLIYPLQHSFYESCRSKLDWASRLGNPAAGG
ncbi:MAG: NAD(+) kinase [Pseudomonadales bacterium]|nr:NAD(+) kinase [Pseudomonadales bacterium]